MSSRRCEKYVPHAFLQNGRCRDCDRPEAEHVAAKSATSPAGADAAAVAAVDYEAAFSNIDAKKQVKKKDCKHYTPHAWIKDRCRDCGGIESVHETSEIKLQKEREQNIPLVEQRRLSVRQTSVETSTTGAASSSTGSTFTTTGPPVSSSVKRMSIVEISSARHLEGAEQAKSYEELRKKEHAYEDVIHQMMLIDAQFEELQNNEKNNLANNTITQIQFEENMKRLQEAYEKKENEMRLQIEAAQRALAEANTQLRVELEEERKQRELHEAALVAEKARATAQLTAAQNETKEALERAEEERKKAEEARAVAEAERKKVEEAKAAAVEERKKVEEAKAAAEVERKKVEEAKAAAEEERKKVEEMRRAAEEQKRELDRLRAEAEQRRAEAEAAWKEVAKQNEVIQGYSAQLTDEEQPTTDNANATAATNNTTNSSSSNADAGEIEEGATIVAREKVAKLSEVLQQVQKLFQEGRNLIRYRVSQPFATHSSVFVREITNGANAGGAKEYGLYWSRVGDRTLSATRCLPFSEITQIVQGPQHPSLLQKGAPASTATLSYDERRTFFEAVEPENIVSFVGKNHTLHLQFSDQRDAETWAFGIASLLKEYGYRASFVQANQWAKAVPSTSTMSDASLYAAYAEKEAQQEWGEEFDGAKPLTPEDILSSRGIILQPPKRYEVDILAKCNNLPSVHKNTIICLVDRDDRTNKLLCLYQSPLISNTNSPNFSSKAFPLSYVSESGRAVRFNVYDVPPTAKSIEEQYRIGSVAIVIQDIADRPLNTETVYFLQHKDKERNEKLVQNKSSITVSCSSKKDITPPSQQPASSSSSASTASSTASSNSSSASTSTTPSSTSSSSSANSSSTSSSSSAEGAAPLSEAEKKEAREELRKKEKVLQQGDMFINHVEGFEAQNVTVYYRALAASTRGSVSLPAGEAAKEVATANAVTDPDAVVLGTLTWASLGSKPESILLRTVVDVFVGKKHSVFPADVKDEHCFSLVSRSGTRLDLEARSKAQRDTWVQSIIALLKAAALQQTQIQRQQRAASIVAGSNNAPKQ